MIDAAAADPWGAAAPRGDDPPSLAERHKLADAACPKVTGAYFFQVEKDGKISHILGSRHIGVPLSKFPAPVHEALKSASLAVFEVAPGDDSDIEAKDVSLPEVLGPDLWARYQSLVGPDLAQGLERSSPATAMLTVMALYEDLTAMLDSEIERVVLEAKIPTAGLERSAFQDQLLERMLDVRMLRAEISHIKDRKELADDAKDDLVEYCAGTDETAGTDDDTRADMLASGYTTAEIDKIDEDMMFARNARWIPQLEKILTKANVFVVVGADHLKGPRGVISLLATRGFKTTRITQ